MFKRGTPVGKHRRPLTKIKLYWSLKMADIKVAHEAVTSAEQALWGAVADAQSWVQLYPTTEQHEALTTLARGIFSRLCDAIEDYTNSALVHGVPSLLERTGEDIQ